ERGALALAFPQRLVDLAGLLVAERVALLGRRRAVALLGEGDDLVERARIEAHVEGFDLVLAQVEGDARLDAAEVDARVVAAPVGGAALPFELLAVRARKLLSHLGLGGAKHDAVDVEPGARQERDEEKSDEDRSAHR